MIDYSDHDSPFFKINQNELELFLGNDGDQTCTGWCNAYGFEIEISTPNGRRINYSKSQLSHQDPLIPRRATNLYRYKFSKKTNVTGYCYFGKWSWLLFWLPTKIMEGKTIKIKDIDSSTVEALNGAIKMTLAEKCLLKNGEITIWSRKQQESVTDVLI